MDFQSVTSDWLYCGILSDDVAFDCAAAEGYNLNAIKDT